MSHTCGVSTLVQLTVRARDQARWSGLVTGTFTYWPVAEVLVSFPCLVMLGVVLEMMSPRNGDKSRVFFVFLFCFNKE